MSSSTSAAPATQGAEPSDQQKIMDILAWMTEKLKRRYEWIEELTTEYVEDRSSKDSQHLCGETQQHIIKTMEELDQVDKIYRQYIEGVLSGDLDIGQAVHLGHNAGVKELAEVGTPTQ
jgi:hypothetical protein